jgi:hypothetical protein
MSDVFIMANEYMMAWDPTFASWHQRLPIEIAQIAFFSQQKGDACRGRMTSNRIYCNPFPRYFCIFDAMEIEYSNGRALNSHSLRFDGFRSINPRLRWRFPLKNRGYPQFLSIYRWNFHGNHPSSDKGYPPWLWKPADELSDLPPLSCWSWSLHSQDCSYLALIMRDTADTPSGNEIICVCI